jgi:octaprenyl-diphosphate synthase
MPLQESFSMVTKAENPAREVFLNALKNLSSLQEVENRISTTLRSDSSPIEQTSRYLFELGGKRIRPAICLLLGESLLKAQHNEHGQLIQISAGIELIHMATLLHDDIIDKSPLRRHQTSPFIKFGMNASLLSGDFLLTRAFRLCAGLDAFIIEETEKACIELTEGEMDETPLSEYSHTVETYREIARKKTASLFRLAAVSAGHCISRAYDFSESLDKDCNSLCAQFGESLGIAFQILDDLLDVLATEAELGKEPGIDIRERKPSLVNVLWLASGHPAATVLKTPASDNSEEEAALVHSALNELKQSDVLAQVKSYAEQEIREARRALSQLQEILPKNQFSVENFKALEALLEYSLVRQY